MEKSKKFITVTSFLISVIFLSFLGFSMAGNTSDNTKVYSKSTDIYAQISDGYNGGELGPIMIVNGTLTTNSKTKDVYWVFLSGTEFVDGQATGLLTDLLVGFEQDNDYLKSVVSAISENIPANSNIILSGHSLGGMIAQQVSGNSTIKKGYNILNVVTFGSPLVNPIGREGTVKRLGDKTDLVPYLSASGAILPLWQVIGLNREDGDYSNPLTAHTESYARTDIWSSYDVLGIKKGTSTFTFNADNLKHYKCPATVFSLSYSATERALEALKGNDQVNVTSTDDAISFIPTNKTPDTAFIFYPGAMVSPEAYSNIMLGLAGKGYLAIIADMPLDLAILDTNAADDIIEKHPEISNWYIGGHSLGGSMSSKYAADNADKIKGIVFLASYASCKLSSYDMKSLSLYGSCDKVLSSLQYKINASNLPSDFTEYIIEGGNHAQFADYGKQIGDGTATITAEEQQEYTIEKISEFMK